MADVYRGQAALLALLVVAGASVRDAAASGQCRVVDVEFVPAELATGPMKLPLQMVVWIETPQGGYVDTAFMTQQTAMFGLGNRPGRFDFNSGPRWPYGRRTTVFPVWAHRYETHRAATNIHPPFPAVVFQNADEDNLSHPFNQSSREVHFCRPVIQNETAWAQADAGTCASSVYTDKGLLGTGTSLYPPRADLERTAADHTSVGGYAALNPFDAISGATPANGSPALVSWPIPSGLANGNYVLWMEVSREFDHNAAYSTTMFPAPTGIPWAEYGRPYRGQPSVLYRVPFTVGTSQTTATTALYAGYGAPDGMDGGVRAPDVTITQSIVGSGAQRLALANGYRVRVTARPEPDFTPPGAPGEALVAERTSRGATLIFFAPGDDGTVGKAKGYEIRLRADGEPITEENFTESFQVTTPLPVNAAGELQQLTIDGLLFDTPYTVGIRAFDDCRNVGPITQLSFRTRERQVGEVDACFVATAAYGSVMANDVEMLRRFRDTMLSRTVLGELAVEAYYVFGPAVAGPIGESDLLRATARAVLDPIVETVRALRW